ncbi:MAG: FAD-binding protein [Desulfobacteraceae bacterium]|nr:FAD-binding protein [Desulfobacteraceae bacterium]
MNIYTELAEYIDGDTYPDSLRRYLLSTDGSIFQREPSCVVCPRHEGDVVHTVKFAKKHGMTVHPRGAGSGLCGSALGTGIVLEFTKYMNRLISVDFENKSFECEPGFRLGQLEVELKGKGLFFPPDPSSGEYASFGGMYSTNASGAHSVKYGNVSDYILDADVVLSSGHVITLSDIRAADYASLPENLQKIRQMYNEHWKEIENAYPDIPCNVAGYNLRGLVQNGQLCLEKLFAGAEGTLGVVTRLKFRLLDKPAHDSLVVAFFDDIVSSAKAVQQILPMKPSGIEVMDKSLLKLARESDKKLRDKIPDRFDNVLLIEFDSPVAEECAQSARETRKLLNSENLAGETHLAVSAEEKEKFWAVRKAAVPILYKLKGEKKILALIEDAAVPTDCLIEYFKGIYDILNRHNVSFVVYGHIAKGLLHTRPLLNLKDSQDIALLKILADEVFELVSSLGGSVSGEHGDGRLRSAYIKRQYPEIYDRFLDVKRLFDAKDMFNPEIKTVHDPGQMKKMLRYGAEYVSSDIGTKALNWPEGFTREAEKCHGCSKCTTVTNATRMCPVYKCTRDEEAAPRAKANLLRALISGAVSAQALYENTFQQVIDKCINCGTCYKECPSNVNIPKLAVEARAQHIKQFCPSMEVRLLTGAELAGRTVRKFSGPLEFAMSFHAVRKSAELLTGISAQRKFPGFPSRSLFERVGPEQGDGPIRVLYFAGCYAGYIRPETGQAAITVLKKLGMKVYIPEQHCCGLPMISKGMTDKAVEKIRQNLKKWIRLLSSINYVAVTCSSCGLSLMQEWAYLLDSSEIMNIKEKVVHISSLVSQYIEKLSLKPYPGKTAYHNPCHLKIQPDADSSVVMLSNVPYLEVEDLKSRCCGMAGSWGMAADHYDLSKKIGSDMISRLDISEADMGVTDCPTCRIQMEQFSRKPICHPIEIIEKCI